MAKTGNLQSLIKSAGKKEQEVQQIKSIVEENKDIENNTIESESKHEKKVILPEKKDDGGISHFFEDRKITKNEGVRIPSEMHKQLKMLATLSNTPLTIVITNILDKVLTDKEKEIQRYIKQNL